MRRRRVLKTVDALTKLVKKTPLIEKFSVTILPKGKKPAELVAKQGHTRVTITKPGYLGVGITYAEVKELPPLLDRATLKHKTYYAVEKPPLDNKPL